MVERTSPISDRYFRYIASWSLFGVLGTIVFSQWSLSYVFLSIAIAFLLSFGIDIVTHFIVRQKVQGIVKEKPIFILEAAMARGEKRGYLVVTKNHVLFVPLFKKIKTVLKTESVIRYKLDRQRIEITAKFSNRYRTYSYNVSSTKKLIPITKEYLGKSLPYKYDKLQNKAYR